MRKKIALLGSTGSIGTSTLKVITHLSDEFTLFAIAAKSNVDLLVEQALQFKPEYVVIFDKDKALELQKRLPGFKVLTGMEGLVEVATHPSVDMVVAAMVGTCGLIPTVAALEAKKPVALANKEVLVSAGEFVMSLAKKNGVKLLPIDSEHSALFQCLENEDPQTVRRLIITASGGPFRTWDKERMKSITIEDALNHPTWKMGSKITIDSSTLMNKGLEVIEARWLFDIDVKNIEVVVHPQSIVHSMVEFVDKSIIAQMSRTDMISPIQYALTYPKRLPGLLEPFDFTKHHSLEFFPPDYSKFKCLKLAFDSLREGGSLACYMNAANEVLVNRFLNKEISWYSIGDKLESLMQKHTLERNLTLETILEVDTLARAEAKRV